MFRINERAHQPRCFYGKNVLCPFSFAREFFFLLVELGETTNISRFSIDSENPGFDDYKRGFTVQFRVEINRKGGRRKKMKYMLCKIMVCSLLFGSAGLSESYENCESEETHTARQF
jgi:hypothetical protein